jgi:3-hydroxyisobutyrate dehydrogenase-like beta-hydroxyacid dehydrogenase
MPTRTIGILHPGAMGVSVAAALAKAGHRVLWQSDGRSPATVERATVHGLTDAGTLSHLVASSDVIISVCPPAAALEVAHSVTARGFRGLYVDANAIAPQKARAIGEIITSAGGRFVDGGIIGGPAWQPGTTWLHLSGPEAHAVAALFAAGPLETHIVSERMGDASAVKMCYAANSKGATALLAGVVALAEALGVRDALESQWTAYDADMAEQTQQRLRRVTQKAWRFTGEMDEIAATFADAGLPAGFHEAAAAVYARLAGFKDADPLPELSAVLAALVGDATTTHQS